MITAVYTHETTVPLLGASHELDIGNGTRDTIKDLMNNSRGAAIGEVAGSRGERILMILDAIDQGRLACIEGTSIVGC